MLYSIVQVSVKIWQTFIVKYLLITAERSFEVFDKCAGFGHGEVFGYWSCGSLNWQALLARNKLPEIQESNQDV